MIRKHNQLDLYGFFHYFKTKSSFKIKSLFASAALLPPDTAITMPRTKAVRYWTRVLIKCAGTDSAQITTAPLQPVCCVSYGHSSLSSCCPNIFKKETALLQSNCIFQGMNPNTLQEPNGSRRSWMSSHHFPWPPFTVGMCDVVIPTLYNSEKLSPFWYLLTFFLLCWEEGFANNQAIS